MLLSTLSLGLALLQSAIAGELTKPYLFENLDKFGPTFQQFPKVGYRLWQWQGAWQRMPKGCYDEIRRNGRDPMNFDTFTIKTDDCGDEFWFCLEKGAPTSKEELADNFARVPVRMRQWIHNIVHYKDGGGAHMFGCFINLFGRTTSTGVLFHEISHAVDLCNGFFLGKHLSDDKIWLDAYNRDSAVPDKYAQTNQIENLAQFPGLIVYDRFTGGALQRENGISRIGNQLQTAADQGDWENGVRARLYDLPSTGIKCSTRFPPQAVLDKTNGKPWPNAKVRLRNSDIVYAQPPRYEDAVLTNCTTFV